MPEATIGSGQKRQLTRVLVRDRIVGRNTSLPERPCPGVPDGLHGLDLVREPSIHRDASDLGDVHSERAMAAGAVEAEEDPEIRRGPCGLLACAVGAEGVLALLWRQRPVSVKSG